MRNSKRHTDVAIIGGGFAGVYTTKSICKKLGSDLDNTKVTIISDDNHLVFQPMLPEVAGSALSPRHVVNSIRHLCREATVLKGEVTDIDPDNKTLTLDGGAFIGSVDVTFEHLIVCLGSHTNLSMIPGMQEHAFLMQNVGDAMLLRATVISRFEEANMTDDPEIKRRLLSFVFVGGGYSGVETAGQVLDMGKAMCKYYKGIEMSDCTYTLVHSGETLLPTADARLGRYTQRKLEERGLVVKTKTRVSAVTANRVHLNDDSVVESNTVLAAIGNAPHPFLKRLSEKTGIELERGKIRVNPDGSVDNITWLWGAGDCTAFPHPDEGVCPPNAQFATRQGNLVGKNVARRIAGRPTKKFDFAGLGELAAVGHRTAVAEIRGMRFSGFIAWWMWRSIYLAKLPGLDRKLRVMFEWTLELFFPKDLTLLNPRYSSDVNETYLADGDKLFQAGDPAFSFYMVKKGTIAIRDGDTTIKTIRQGQHFGERALLGDGFFRYDAIATEPTTLVSLNRHLFTNLFQSDTTFAENLERTAASYFSEGELDEIIKRMPEAALDQQVGDLMTRELITFKVGQTLADAMKQLNKRSRNYIPVIDEQGRIQFIVKKESIYLRIQSSDQQTSEPLTKLPQVNLPIVDQTESVRSAITTIARSGYTKAFVTDSEGKLSGVIALIDIFAHDAKTVVNA